MLLLRRSLFFARFGRFADASSLPSHKRPRCGAQEAQAGCDRTPLQTPHTPLSPRGSSGANYASLPASPLFPSDLCSSQFDNGAVPRSSRLPRHVSRPPSPPTRAGWHAAAGCGQRFRSHAFSFPAAYRCDAFVVPAAQMRSVAAAPAAAALVAPRSAIEMMARAPPAKKVAKKVRDCPTHGLSTTCPPPSGVVGSFD